MRQAGRLETGRETGRQGDRQGDGRQAGRWDTERQGDKETLGVLRGQQGGPPNL